jgi:hypothetical protein
MRVPTVLFASLLVSSGLFADEGMWLFNNPPLAQLKSRYKFEPTAAWLEHLQKSSVRFNNGGSGSFVSADGLVMTNHHVASDCLHKISSKEKDYLTSGFLAAKHADEPKCVDLELNVLMSIEDVTERVNAAVKPGMDPSAAQKARTAAMNTIEKESLDKTKLRSDVVTLYQGARYHLYRYKKYTDVRLAFAPERDIAFFGGDPDNFEYPRYTLDVTFFRAYENGQPAKIEHYLRWSEDGARENELIFVSGHPGRTDRLNTVRHLEYIRDVFQPLRLQYVYRREVLLSSWSERTAENARRAQDLLLAVQNSRKARKGMLAGLQDPSIMVEKRQQEQVLRAAVSKNPEWKKQYSDAWTQVDAAVERLQRLYKDYFLWEFPAGFACDLFGIARNLVRLAEETKKPNAERLREFAESGLDSLKQELFSEAPIYDDFETILLADSLTMLVELAGADNDAVRKVLAGKSPQERAAELVRDTRLKDVAFRKKLAEGGLAAIQASDDPMIRLAREVDPHSRSFRTASDQIEESLKQAYSKIAQARFAAHGSTVYPDATFTLRLSFGETKGYVENGQKAPWTTTLGGVYSRSADHKNQEPFRLPKSWIDGKNSLDLNTPFNFVSTPDIIGGNSGSPVVNRNGELIGLIFDGNPHSLVLDYVYDDEPARAISVHSAVIVEALKKIYKASDLVKEITR